MKNSYLRDMTKIIVRNMKMIFSSNKTLLMIFHILQIMSLIALLYSFSYMRIENDNYQSVLKSASTYIVDFSEGAKYKEISYKLNQLELSDIIEVEIFLTPDYSVLAKYKSKSNKVDYGRYIEEKNEIIYEYSMFDKDSLNINEKVEVLGRTFTIVGLRMKTYSEISINSILEDDLIYGLSVNYNKIYNNESKRKEISDSLNKIFNTRIIKPVLLSTDEKFSIDTVFLSIVVLVFIILINIILIYRFMINKGKMNYAIYFSSGIKKKNIIIAIIIELIIYFLIDLVIVSLIWHLLVKNIIERNYVIKLQQIDFLISIICYIVLMVVVFSYNIYKFFARSFIKYLK